MGIPLPIKQETLVGCPYCDLLIKHRASNQGFDACCPRCGALLIKASTDSLNRTLALSISGIIIFFPACFLPLLELNIFGYTGSCTMIKGVLQMIKTGYWWMSGLVLFCSILAPIFIQFLLFIITCSLILGLRPAILVQALKLYQTLTEWAMLDVYMLGILIAFIKMKDFGDLFSGPGLYCFIGLLGMTTLSMLSFDKGLAWTLLERPTP